MVPAFMTIPPIVPTEGVSCNVTSASRNPVDRRFIAGLQQSPLQV